MASDFSAAWQFFSNKTTVFRYRSKSTPSKICVILYNNLQKEELAVVDA
jgi:hypothetical protein